ncbi:hypothetical protein BCON_1107g00010 [Botryotinia convoluta]|uniref:Uncharacterized protein n=1 Tax=Botryotinia convoluta TaxID=54673 RepID=A0A4Z1H590_9HELO|nr:hypothetical protein BCON_1107g00010 [Botryotinia convoluta]
MGFLTQGKSTSMRIRREKAQPWKAFVNHQQGQVDIYEKHEAFKNQIGEKKPWNEWLHSYTGIIAAPKTPAPPKPEVIFTAVVTYACLLG